MYNIFTGFNECRTSLLMVWYYNYFPCFSSLLEDCKWGSDRIEYFSKHFLVCSGLFSFFVQLHVFWIQLCKRVQYHSGSELCYGEIPNSALLP